VKTFKNIPPSEEPVATAERQVAAAPAARVATLGATQPAAARALAVTAVYATQEKRMLVALETARSSAVDRRKEAGHRLTRRVAFPAGSACARPSTDTPSRQLWSCLRRPAPRDSEGARIDDDFGRSIKGRARSVANE
jgi:hypothetical protein